ncbi:MAG: cyclase family protein [Candidatus Cyclobacteriaceae bacterium M2_1C_046]
MWKDITYPITNQMPPYPGQPEVKITKLCTIGEEGAVSNVTLINTSVHTGTHMDAPLHFIADGADITDMPLETGMGEGKIIEIEDPEAIYPEEIKRFEGKYGPVNEGERVFFKTINSSRNWTKEEFDEGYIYLSKEAAEYLVEKKIAMVGIDYLSISKGDINREVHQVLLGNNCWIIEGLDLRNVDEGLYDIICLPIKIQNSDGAPSRVVVKAL